MTLEASLTDLEQAQLVRQLHAMESTLMAELGAAYQFKHSLTQEAAYRSLPRRQRQQTHRRVAECYEQIFANRLDEHAALLSHHYAEAGDETKTFDYSRRAGDAALRMYATTEAVAHYQRAIALAGITLAPTEQLIHLYNRRGRALELASRFAEALSGYEEMEIRAHELGDARVELAALMAQARLRSTVNPLFDPDLGRALAERALRLADELGDCRSQAEAYWNLMNQARFGGGSALEYGERALALARAADWPEQLAYILNDLADVYGDAGRLTQARSALDEARHLWRTLDNQPMLSDNLTLSGMYYTILGDFTAALAAFEEAYTIGQRIQNIWGQAFAQGFRGIARWYQGEYGMAIADFETGAALADEVGFLVGRMMPRAMLAMVYLELGAPHLALDLAKKSEALTIQFVPQFYPIVLGVLAYATAVAGLHEDAAAYLRQSGAPDDRGESDFLSYFRVVPLVRLALHDREFEKALALSELRLETVRRTRMKSLVVELLELRGEALAELGRTDEAHTSLLEARRLAEEVGLRRSLWRVQSMLADLSPDAGSAEQLRAEAAEIVRSIADGLPNSELRASFLNMPRVQSVLTL